MGPERKTFGRAASAAVLVVASAGVLSLPTATLVALPAAASTSDPEDSIVRYDALIELDERGTASVTLDLDVDFGSDPNRGPYLTYVVKQRFDDDQDRVYRYSDIEASSSTGAADQVNVEEESGWLEVRIGEEDRDEFTGVHSYLVTYTVEGWVNSAAAFDDLTDDELYLNVIGDRWDVPIEQVGVTVVGPQDVVDAACFAGPAGADTPCDTAKHLGTAAHYTQAQLPAGSAMTVVAAFPAGTFGDVEPILQERWSPARAFALTPATGGLAALLAVAGTWWVVRTARRRGRDEQYLGLTPGLRPASGQHAGVGPRRAGPVAVQFTPPEGFRPGQIGTLLDEQADAHDVTATLVDLAVRGYLRIDGVEPPSARGKGGDWRLTRLTTQDDRDLQQAERTLLAELFEGRDQVLLSDLRTTFSSSMSRVRGDLYADVTAQGWFRGNPSSVRTRWALRGAGVLLGGIALTALLAVFTSWAVVGLPVVLLGILLLATTGTAPARTADGTAVLVQAQGFRHYIATAEADQLRFEEGQDLFSRYLPWAIAFGLTERWARLFAQLAAQGRPVADPTWYHGSTPWAVLWATGAFADELSAFTHIAEESLTAPTPGSSGSSGGGGFSGGGVGGGGGGTW